MTLKKIMTYLIIVEVFGGQPIIHSRSFKDGFVSIQDKSSMFVAHIMNVDRHDHV